MIDASVPVIWMAASSVPSPWVNVSPFVPDNVSEPLPTDNVVVTGPAPASTSVTEIGLPLPLENVRVVSSSIVCAAGTWLTGGSFTHVTVTETVAVEPPGSKV